MSLRIPVTYFKNFHMKKPHLFIYASQHPLPNLHYSASSNTLQSITSDKVENIQFPKHVQPLVNHSVDEILNISSASITADECVSVLKALRMFKLFKNVQSDHFKTDERFEVLCNVFENYCHMLYPSLLVSGLRSLLEVGVSPNSSCVTTAELSIIDNIHLFSTFSLIGCLYFHHKFMETDLQKKVVSVLVKELCGRIPDISSKAEVLMLVHFLNLFNRDDQKKVEEKVIALIKTLNCHEMCKMFVTLAENSNRNKSVLCALAVHLRTRVENLQIKEILDILYSFKKLNFYDSDLAVNLMHRVCNIIPAVNQPSVISGLLTTCGYLRLRHTGVLNTCAEWIVNHAKICRPKEFVSFILTVANLNYHSVEIQKALHLILPFITIEKLVSPDVWLDVVWSLAILNYTDKEMLLKVLSPEFYKSLVDNSDFQSTTNKLKLMNLKAVLKNYYPECIFGCDLFLDPLEIPQSKEIQNSRKHVLSVLSIFVPKDKYLCINQSTDMGIFIDAEFIMSKNRKPLTLSEYGIVSKVTDTKPLPIGAQRIALMILFFKDFTIHSQSRTGFNDLAIRLLFSRGYTAVPISYDEFMKNDTEVKKAKYLLQKISTIMRNVEGNEYKFNIELFH